MISSIPNAINERFRKLVYDTYQQSLNDPGVILQAIVNQYAKELWDDLQHIRDISHEPLPHIAMEQTIYWHTYENHLSEWLQRHAATSTALADDRSQQYEQFRKWRNNALETFAKNANRVVHNLQKARQKLEEKENIHRNIDAANKIVRQDGPDKYSKLRELGFTEELIFGIAKKGFQPLFIQHNADEISRLRSRIAILESKVGQAKTRRGKTGKVNGVKLVRYYQADGTQIIIDGNADPKTTNALSSQGIKLTPSQRAWQKKLAAEAIDAAKNIAKGIRKR